MDAENCPPKQLSRDQSENMCRNKVNQNAGAMKPGEVQRRPLATVQNNDRNTSAAINDTQRLGPTDSSQMPPRGSTSDTESKKIDIVPFESEEHHEDSDEWEYRVRFVSRRVTERKLEVKPIYMRTQDRFGWEERSILIDWLVDVSDEFKFCSETIHLSVCYLDRFLAKYRCRLSYLQLVGVTALYLAAKYEEVKYGKAECFVGFTNSQYTVNELLSMETKIIKALDYKLTQPTTHAFLLDYIYHETREPQGTSLDDLLKLEQLSAYISELALLRGKVFLDYLPSLKAASAIYLAASMMKLEHWVASFPKKSGYSKEEMIPCIRDMYFMVNDVYFKDGGYVYPAIWDKYSKSEFGSVALIKPPQSLSQIV